MKETHPPADPDFASHLAKESAERWERHFAQLAAFRERFGHCRVPSHWPEDAALGGWVRTQRAARRKGKLGPECLQRLEAVGFAWNVKSEPAPRPRSNRPPRPRIAGLWEIRFAQLAAFRERFGHCRVPRAWREVPGLGNWTRTQRAVRRKGQLKPERIRRLEGIGFEWGRGPKDG